MSSFDNLVAAFVLFLAAASLFCFYILVRNNKVFNYRFKILSQIDELAKADIRQCKEWKWRYDNFSQVSYGRMMWQFWRPLKSFYKDTNFLR